MEAMTKKVTWRLAKLPTPDEVRGLVHDKIITQEEARDILIGSGEDVKSLKEEVEFLRNLVSTLSKKNSAIVETIKFIERPYHKYDWYKPYEVWCDYAGGSGGTAISFNAVGANSFDTNATSIDAKYSSNTLSA